MIYIDLKIFSLNKIIDLKLDETILVSEVIDEISSAFALNDKQVILFSLFEKKILRPENSLLEQGIRGGDRLILVERENL